MNRKSKPSSVHPWMYYRYPKKDTSFYKYTRFVRNVLTKLRFFYYLLFITKDLLIRLLGSLKLKYHFLVIYYWSIIQYFGVFISTWGDGKATRSWITSARDRILDFKCKMFIFDLCVHARALGWIATDLLIYSK